LQLVDEMSMLLANVTHFLGITTIRRSRVLPSPGKVVVRKGQKVAATDVVAQAVLKPEHMVLDVARGLGLSPSKADGHIQREVGEEVEEGDLIAGPVGVSRRVVRAPKNGRIVMVAAGQVLLELQTSPFELKAGLSGVVAELINSRGVVIENTGALVQCAWGNGRIDAGLLRVLASSPGEQLTADRLEVSHRGAVILAGYCEDPAVLTLAAEIPLKALILSSMDASLVDAAEKIKCPVVLIEGFGKIPHNEMAFKLLSTNEGREVAVNGENWDRWAGTRPELFIPLPAAGSLSHPPDQVEFASGQKVRLVSASQRGQTGTITSLLPGLSPLSHGIKAHAAEVRLDSGETEVIALANMEVLN
jgi:hypothetical protein